MAKLIVKWRYIKHGTPKHAQHLVKYIATREGVEKCDESWKLQPPTREQTRLITKLLKDFPSMEQSHEYDDYKDNPNKYTASSFISKTIDENIDIIGKKENYVGYIAMRPRVEKQGSHGLFSQSDEPINLDEVAKTVAQYQGIVWTTVLSLRREDASRLDYDNAKSWRMLLRDQAPTLAKAMGIPITDLRWYAAFHDEGGHPHVHLVSYSVGKQPYMTEEQLHAWKSKLATQIFKQDLMQTYQEQTKIRDELRETGQERMREIIAQINNGTFENETVEALLLRLRDELKDYKGKMVYGYLPASAKNIIDGIVDELASDERIKELYDLWYEQKEAVIKTYKDIMPERIPLSKNNEFKTIRNAILKEIQNISLGLDTVEDILFEDEPEDEPSDEDIENDEPEMPKNKWEIYRAAKEMLDRDSENYNPSRAVEYFMEAVKQGCDIAKYQLGKLFLRGEHLPKNIDYAIRWLEDSVEDGNQYAEYLLGKLLLKGEDTERNAERAEELLRKSADQGNKYAAYTLGKALLDGDVISQNIPEGLKYLTESADKGFAQAEYLLGKYLYHGDICDKDIPKALSYLERAAGKNNAYAAYLAGKIYYSEESVRDVEKAIRYFEIAAEQGNSYAQFQLGKIYLFGKDAPKDYAKAMEYLKASAENGNKYAENLQHSVASNRNWSVGMGAFRLFSYLCRLIQNRIEDEKKGKLGLIDRKLRREINEKKQAQGLKIE